MRSKVAVTDFLRPDTLAQDLDALRSEFEGWKTASARGTHRLWALLGNIYELGTVVHANPALRLNLVRTIEKNPGFSGSNRWSAEGKSAFELLIALLLNLGDANKGTRSQWLSALKAAKKASVPATKAQFVDWIRNLGGVEAARKMLVKGAVRDDVQTLASQLDEFVDHEIAAFPLPERLSDQGFPRGYGLVLVKQIGTGSEAIPVVSIENERQVAAAMKAVLSAYNRQERAKRKEYQAGVSAEQRRRKARVRQLYREAVRAGRTTAEYDEYLWEWENENLTNAADLPTRITEP